MIIEFIIFTSNVWDSVLSLEISPENCTTAIDIWSVITPALIDQICHFDLPPCIEMFSNENSEWYHMYIKSRLLFPWQCVIYLSIVVCIIIPCYLIEGIMLWWSIMFCNNVNANFATSGNGSWSARSTHLLILTPDNEDIVSILLRP